MKKSSEITVAIKLINEAVTANTERLRTIASGSEQDPILLEGETSTGRYCQMMVGPKEVAQVFLRYQYSIWKILDLDAPDAMWDELARIVGLKSVCSVDL